MDTKLQQNSEIETHPWPPFVPPAAKVLIMGTFPPGRHRWSMDFFYPNRTNDFWFMMGLLFYGDRDALYDRGARRYRLDQIKRLLTDRGIAMCDTGYRIRRLKGNASDKYLEIVEPVHLDKLLGLMPGCTDIATTGEKAASVMAGLTGTEAPKMGNYDTDAAGHRIWRMPSTSRAYPLALEKKAEYYARLFEKAGVLPV